MQMRKTVAEWEWLASGHLGYIPVYTNLGVSPKGHNGFYFQMNNDCAAHVFMAETKNELEKS